jgi:hypothetical protein
MVNVHGHANGYIFMAVVSATSPDLEGRCGGGALGGAINYGITTLSSPCWGCGCHPFVGLGDGGCGGGGGAISQQCMWLWVGTSANSGCAGVRVGSVFGGMIRVSCLSESLQSVNNGLGIGQAFSAERWLPEGPWFKPQQLQCQPFDPACC